MRMGTFSCLWAIFVNFYIGALSFSHRVVIQRVKHVHMRDVSVLLTNRIWHLPLSCNRSDSFYSRFLDAHGAVKHAVSSLFISVENSKAKIRRNRYGRYGRIDKR